MITFRLNDSVPKKVIKQWKIQLNNENLDNHTDVNSKDDACDNYSDNQKKLLILIDKYEDAGYGECILKNERAAEIVHEALFYYNNKKYNIISWCIMPNHVHVLLEISNNISLSEILHSWRSYSSKSINKLLKRIGKLWMTEYFDRYIRDNTHFNKVIDYIHNNPVKAGLVSAPHLYKWSSAGYVD